jgi:hypothetical protein
MGSFSRYASDDIAISTDKVTSNAWTDDTNILTTFHTSSTQAVFTKASSQGNFYQEVYKNAPSTTSSIEFTVGYGHKAGSGSQNFTDTAGALGNTATKCIYNQYRQLVFGDELSNFTFNSYESNDIYVVNVNRARYKHNLLPGSLNLKLTGNYDFHLTDDSVTSSGSATITNIGRQFNIVSGSDGVMSGSSLNQTTAGSGSFGFFYPDAGIIIFNPEAFRNVDAAKFLEGTDTTAQERSSQFIRRIKTGASFEIDSEERISSQYLFTRIKNSEFNYSSNPSYIDTNGNLNNSTMADSPVTYVTTIGLYNDDNNLIAVAKLSQPLKKDFTTEALVRVKLDY